MKKSYLHAGLIYSLIHFFSTFPISPGEALTIKSLSFADIVEHSETMIHGIVMKIESRRDEKIGAVCTYTTIRVIDVLKGSVDAKEYTYKQFGGVDKMTGIEWMSPSIMIQPGEEVVLCLYPPSRWGLSSPVGFSQGVFSVKEDRETREKTLDNGMAKSVLFPEKTNPTQLLNPNDDPDERKRSQNLDDCKSMKLDDVKQWMAKWVQLQNKHSKQTSLQKMKITRKTKNAK
ncbi:MAG: hypothetical protein C4527_22095 [Candidatus Omnitrophota bacterium]|nr:MAG: hypothetical protein C4527_22095 [Candidatus Omnitrophota bacterium]